LGKVEIDARNQGEIIFDGSARERRRCLKGRLEPENRREKPLQRQFPHEKTEQSTLLRRRLRELAEESFSGPAQHYQGANI
jgi:hypothetical protein